MALVGLILGIVGFVASVAWFFLFFVIGALSHSSVTTPAP